MLLISQAAILRQSLYIVQHERLAASATNFRDLCVHSMLSTAMSHPTAAFQSVCVRMARSRKVLRSH